MSQTPDDLPRRNRRAVAAAFLAQGLGFAAVLTKLPEFKDRWGIDDLGVTLIMFSVAVLAGIASVLAGKHAAERGSGTTLRVGLVTVAVGLAVTATAPAMPVFLLGLGIYGLGLGGVDASSNMQAVALEAAYGRSILTSFHGAWSTGGILGALATAATAHLGWSIPAALLPIAIVPAVVATLPFLPGHDPVEATAADGPRIPWKPLLVLGTALVLFYVADSAASTWSTIYLSDVLLASAGVAPLAYGAYQATSLASRLLGDLAVRRVGPVLVVTGAAIVAAAGLATVVLAPAPWVAIVGFAVLGVGLAVVAPLTFSAAGTLAGDGTPELRRRHADAIVARLNQFNYLGFVLGGVLTGVVGSGSLRVGYLVPLVGVLLIIPLARGFAPRRPAAGSPGSSTPSALPTPQAAPTTTAPAPSAPTGPTVGN
jgi:MFS family permease